MPIRSHRDRQRSAPWSRYWHRFRVRTVGEPTGRTRTAPAAGEAIKSARHRRGVLPEAGVAGYYTAHRHLAAELPDAVVFLGDYIYERTIDDRECGRGRCGPRPI